MVITFSCPNGHRLTASDAQAGRVAKCPDCAEPVQIPSPNSVAVVDEGSRAEASESALNQIEFLCPNGHRIHAPASMAGRPGQCPQCATRFHVPTLEELFEDDEPSVAEEVTGGGYGTPDEDDVALEIPADIEDEESGEYFVASEDVEDGALIADAEGEPQRQAAEMHDLHDTELDELEPHTACALFSRLWQRYAHDAIIEIELANGEKFLPTEFSLGNSRKTHGVFAVRNADGSHTLMVVAWDAVARVSVRGLEELPEDWFE